MEQCEPRPNSKRCGSTINQEKNDAQEWQLKVADLAAMDPAKQREIASKGGKASHGGGRKAGSSSR